MTDGITTVAASAGEPKTKPRVIEMLGGGSVLFTDLTTGAPLAEMWSIDVGDAGQSRHHELQALNDRIAALEAENAVLRAAIPAKPTPRHPLAGALGHGWAGKRGLRQN